MLDSNKDTLKLEAMKRVVGLRGVPPVLQGARAMQDTRRVGVMQTACNMQRGRGKGEEEEERG